jgi:hypothetical protein
MFERLVARAMDRVQAIREESRNVGALVTCGSFYMVSTTRNQTAQVISASGHHEIGREARIERRRAFGNRPRSGQLFALTGN